MNLNMPFNKEQGAAVISKKPSIVEELPDVEDVKDYSVFKAKTKFD